MLDQYGREIDYVRISVTEKCNLSCSYCMPSGCSGYESKTEELTDDEILFLCENLVKVGIKKVKITGGEPLVRKNICNLIKNIKNIDGIEQVTITTNGIQLLNNLKELKSAGIDGINVSLDAIDSDLFKKITGFDKVSIVLEAIEKAIEIGILNIKINCVLIRELNQNQYIRLAKIAKNKKILVRFIEVMPIGHGKSFEVLTSDEVIKSLEEEFGKMIEVDRILGNGPAIYYKINGFKGEIGFISAVSHKFCDDCNRFRVTSDGNVKTCLYFNSGESVKSNLQQKNAEKLLKQLKKIIFNKEKSHEFEKTDNDLAEIKTMVQIGG